MNAEQIRETITREEAKGIPSQAGDYWLREIAAQLAELNEHLNKITEAGGHADCIVTALDNINGALRNR